MILDRDTDAISAAITSIRVVFENTGVMLLWGALLTSLVFLALMPWGAGLLLVGPLLGHASWHAYRGSVGWLEAPAGEARAGSLGQAEVIPVPRKVLGPRTVKVGCHIKEPEGTFWLLPITDTRSVRKNWRRKRKKEDKLRAKSERKSDGSRGPGGRPGRPGV
jgi:hypothetical protein